MKVSAYLAMSLDGYIARDNGGLDWLEKANMRIPTGEDCGYSEYMSSVDCMVMGRKTYEKILTFEYWPYEEKRVIVLSSKPMTFPPKFPKNLSHSSQSPQKIVDDLHQEGIDRIYVDGGKTIHEFIKQKLLTDITITIIPVLIGEGIPLFSTLEKDTSLKHINTKSYDFGFVQIQYEFIYA